MLSPLLLCCALMVADVPAPSPDDRKEYERAGAEAGRDADAHIRLALWCEQHGMKAQRLQHLALAVLYDPTHALARGLMGMVRDGDRWVRPDQVADRVRKDAEQAAALAEYNERRGKTPRTADAQWRLALWCEEKGLKPEAEAHLTMVVRLDPSRPAAWKKLGCKKYRGRWMTQEAIDAFEADVRAQREANRRWPPLLKAWKAELSDPARRAEARRKLSSVDDPRAVLSIWHVFAGGNPADQETAVQLLGQIDTPASSRALALVAVSGGTPEVRRLAAETLRRRDPHDYFGPLIAMLRDALRYEVRPVAGIGSPGALYVEGEQFNRLRVYTPPAPPFALVDFGAAYDTDPFGSYATTTLRGPDHVEVRHQNLANFTGAEFRHGLPDPNDPRRPILDHALQLQGGPEQTRWNVATRLFKPGYGTAKDIIDSDFVVSVDRQITTNFATYETHNVGQQMAEYRKAAAASEQQLEADVAMIEGMNQAIRQNNAQVNTLLVNVSGQSLPPDREAWRAWWADQLGYAYQPTPQVPRPTFVEDLPSPYTPLLLPSTSRIGEKLTTVEKDTVAGHMTYSGLVRQAKRMIFPCCFAEGTPVRTFDGSKPIDELKVGDRVLTQDVETGALEYRPVLTVFHFPPAATSRLRLGDDTIVATPLHKFWKVGHGWVMARDLEPGDIVRTIGGTAAVSSIETDEVRPVFNLEIAGNPAFFVGRDGALAHDNTPAGARIAPFDAPRQLAHSTAE